MTHEEENKYILADLVNIFLIKLLTVLLVLAL